MGENEWSDSWAELEGTEEERESIEGIKKLTIAWDVNQHSAFYCSHQSLQ